MAASSSSSSETEVFSWLKSLPLAPEYHPTLAEFQDPIAYIFKIEKEASKYGICKIVPPVSPPPKKTTISNLNKSLSARSPDSTPTFTTRQQQIGFCPRKHRPVQKPVWQSGETYTVPQFEVKAKAFEKNYLKKYSKKVLTALETETLYWKATVDKPFSIEYANDMPGSAFSQIGVKKKGRETGGDGVNVGDTDWNMRGVSRAKGSLLKFMKEEIPGVTSPMVYIAMMFSWFAWHVEDHDLHSLNYMHMGAGKTWYGVPCEAAVAFEDVIRVHGYGGEINPIVTFATLGEKTTVMSPEVLLSAGVPCCRLVQNAGEFVVTFPRAYHSGFSHGFNCGEAANIATPGWLRVAKDAAIRRASVNCSPMVSHSQLLYDLALSLSSSMPSSIRPEPRSSRLKDKKKGEGETLVKQLFVQDVMQNNDLLQILGKGSPIALLPQSALDKSISPNLHIGSQYKAKPKPSFGLHTHTEEMKSSEHLGSGLNTLDRKQGNRPTPMTGLYWKRGKFSSSIGGTRPSLGGDDLSCSLPLQTQNMDTAKLPDCGLFSCVTCGILCYACVAIIQPSEAAARYLMSADCNVIKDWISGSEVITDEFAANGDASNADLNSSSGRKSKTTTHGLFDVPVKSAEQIPAVDESAVVISPKKAHEDKSSLGLLASTYGDSSDSEDEHVEADTLVNASSDCSSESKYFNTGSPSLHHYSGATSSDEEHQHAKRNLGDRNARTFDCSVELETNNFSMDSDSFGGRWG